MFFSDRAILRFSVSTSSTLNFLVSLSLNSCSGSTLSSSLISETCTRASTDEDSCTNAPNGVIRVILPSTTSPLLKAFTSVSHGSSLICLRLSDNRSLSMAIILALIWSPAFTYFLGSSTLSQDISEMCTSPSMPSTLTKAPKSITPVTTPSTTSPTVNFSRRFCISPRTASFSEKMSLLSLRLTSRMRTFSIWVVKAPSLVRISSLSASDTLG